MDTSDDVERAIEDALANIKKRRYQRALNLCEVALALELSNPRALYLRALSLRLLRNYDQAQAALNEALLLHPNDPVLLTEQGLLLMVQNDNETALEVFDGAVPDDVPPEGTARIVVPPEDYCIVCGSQMQCLTCNPPSTDDEEPGDVLQALRTIRSVLRAAPLSERAALGNLINGELAEMASSSEGDGR